LGAWWREGGRKEGKGRVWGGFFLCVLLLLLLVIIRGHKRVGNLERFVLSRERERE
jgi:hypothetical protein